MLTITWQAAANANCIDVVLNEKERNNKLIQEALFNAKQEALLNAKKNLQLVSDSVI